MEVKAHGITYRGLFIGADEEFVYLKGVTTWISLPMDTVTAIRQEGAGEAEWFRKELPGPPPPSREERESKRTYSSKDLDKIHERDSGGPWPEPDEGEGPGSQG